MIVGEKYPLQNIQEYFPLVCTEEPAAGSAFCSTHSKLVKDCGYETKLKEFITSCGANPSNYTKAEREKVKEVLKSLLRTRENGEQTETAELTQGTSFLLNNSEVTNAANLQFEARPAEENCTKDTRQTVRLHNWTRGIFQVVGPGGIILYWLIDCHLNGKTVFDGPATRQHKDFIFDRLQNQFFILLLNHAPNI